MACDIHGAIVLWVRSHCRDVFRRLGPQEKLQRWPPSLSSKKWRDKIFSGLGTALQQLDHVSVSPTLSQIVSKLKTTPMSFFNFQGVRVWAPPYSRRNNQNLPVTPRQRSDVVRV